MAEVAYNLGGVDLEYCSFVWPAYRGTDAREVVIQQSASMFPALKALPYIVDLTITAPDKAGTAAQQGERKETIKGVRVLRVVKVNDLLCRIYLADARAELARRVGDRDYNVKFADGYLRETEQPTLAGALKFLVSGIDVLRGNVASDAYQRILSREIPQGLVLAGMTLPEALSRLLSSVNADMTVTREGRFRFIDRQDANTGLPGKSDYDWFTEPAWDVDEVAVRGVPRKMRVYYPERHAIKARNLSYGTEPTNEMTVELEQVYSVGEEYLTFTEMLDHYGDDAAALGYTETQWDKIIAKKYMTANFENCELDRNRTVANANRDAILNAIKSDWRTLWRVKLPDALGNIGNWTDWAFGKLEADGTVVPAPVEAPWVEFLGVVELETPQSNMIGARTAINHNATGETAPFSANWEADGIIRLKRNPLADGSYAVLGELANPDAARIQQRTAPMLEADGTPNPISDYPMIESVPREQLEFKQTGFKMFLYLVATRRAPNSRKRWHLEEADASPTGDVWYNELEVGTERFCYRDYVDSSGQHQAQGDGLGAILNQDELTKDAKTRTEMWLLEHAMKFEGDAIAERLDLWTDYQVEGAINEMAIVVDDVVVRTRMMVGNLASVEERQRRAAQRLADRKVVVNEKVVR